MPAFTIRRATTADRPHILGLVSEMVGYDATERYEWLYAGNPHGAALSWLAFASDDPDRAVAVTSVFPRRVMVAGRERTGSIGGDCYVLPSARRRGLATRLHQATIAEMGDGGVEFMYGPPLVNNLHALAKAGSTRVGTYRRFARPLSASAAIKALFRRRLPTGIERVAGLPMKVADLALRAGLRGAQVEVFDQVSDELAALGTSASAPTPICPVRDAAFLQWRYFAATPRLQTVMGIRRGGDLVAAVVYESQAEVAVVVDLFAINTETGDIALQVAVERARSEECERVDFHVTPAGLPPSRLARRGFFPREDRVFQVAVPPDDPQHAVLTDPASWYFTSGDKDAQTCFTDMPT